jgi:hypothetical protein
MFLPLETSIMGFTLSEIVLLKMRHYKMARFV